jgi:predicted site-specific integrase-resolvase
VSPQARCAVGRPLCRLVPIRTEGGQRRYDLAALRPTGIHGAPASRRTVAYARVSSHDQRADLERQKQVLEIYCADQGWPFDIIADLGSSMNYHKRACDAYWMKSWLATSAA